MLKSVILHSGLLRKKGCCRVSCLCELCTCCVGIEDLGKLIEKSIFLLLLELRRFLWASGLMFEKEEKSLSLFSILIGSVPVHDLSLSQNSITR
jgi:hypothetical protein